MSARLLIALAVLLTAPLAARADLAPGDRAPELVKVVDGGGKPVRLAGLKDRVVVMTFGASWCEPCKRELPAFEALARGYQARKAKVTFVAVNIDSEPEKARAFVKQAGLSAVVAAFDQAKSTVESYDPPKMPTTFVIRAGIIRHVHGGYAAGDEKKLAVVVDGELAKL